MLSDMFAVKDKLMAFSDLTTYIAVQFDNATANHFIGYRKISNLEFLPAFCYWVDTALVNPQEAETRISISVQIMNKDDDGDTQQGIVQIATMADMIIEHLMHNPNFGRLWLVDKKQGIAVAIDIEQKFPNFGVFLSVPILKLQTK